MIDSEKKSEAAPLDKGREEFLTTCQNLAITCHVLTRRATENYLTDAAVKSVKGDKYHALGAYEKLADAKLGWSKQDNWKIVSRMTWDDLKDNDLGRFLQSL